MKLSRRGVLQVPHERLARVARIDTGRRDTRQTIHPCAAERRRVLDRLPDARFEFGHAIRMARDPAFTGVPVSSRQIVQRLRQPVRRELFAEHPAVVRVREQVLDPCESGIRGCGKSIQKVDLGEEHREVGGKSWHGCRSRGVYLRNSKRAVPM